MDEIVRAARSLSDPARVRVLNLLMQRECCVCEVMDVLGISQVNASRYCNALKDAGFLNVRRDGRWKHYSIAWDTCSSVLRDMLGAVRKAGETAPQAVEDARRLACSARRCVIPSPTPDMCDACNVRVVVSQVASTGEGDTRRGA
jgi:ArsR family transcriptional regulator, arsenate/arsenite/antimonite-responsive transcriptional repressor